MSSFLNFGMDSSSSSSDTYGSGTPRDPGTQLGSAILNDIFGVDQKLQQGKFVMGGGGGSGAGYTPVTSIWDLQESGAISKEEAADAFLLGEEEEEIAHLPLLHS